VPAIALWPGCNLERGESSALPDGGPGPATASDAGPYPSSPLAMGDFEPCTPPLTEVEQFPAIFGGEGMVSDWEVPSIDAADFTLRVDGLVQTPRSWTLAQLEDRTGDVTTVVNSLLCAFGPTGTQLWTGVPLRSLIDQAQPDRERARRLRLYGADGYTDNLRLDDVYGVDDTSELFPPLLAYRIDGRPLPAQLGFPLRLVLADRYGFKNVKWLQRIELTDDDSAFGMYQADRFGDATDVGRVGPAASIAAPRPPERFAPGPLQICGHAMSGAAGIERVEVTIDGDGPVPSVLLGRDAFLSRVPAAAESLQAQQPERFPYPWLGVWTPYAHDWQADPGFHLLGVRVIDRSGAVSDSLTVEVEVG